jgi:predicted DNA-binding transcriptional regulator YafY
MGDRLKFERFIWFHGRVKTGDHPNSRHLREAFEISLRTAQRDIEFMKDRLGAPLAYARREKGYFYTDNSFELPGLWFSEDVIVALSLAVRLATSIPDVRLKDHLCAFLSEILGRKQKGDLCLEDISERISVKNIEYSRVAGPHFHAVTDALLSGRTLEITYHSPHTGKTTERRIRPLHLLLYMGSWHVIAYCSTRRGLRDFVISRVRSAEPYDKQLLPPKALPSVKEYIRKNFGIMQGGKRSLVKLRFAPAVSGWITEQVWHPAQKASTSKDGSLVLQFPVADFRELKRRILSHGSDVKVISPKRLARQIKNEINKMNKVY